MSLHVPPAAIFAIHGKPDVPEGWVRSRVLFFDDDGDAWTLGDHPWTHPNSKKHHRGDRGLRKASSWDDYLGLEEGADPQAVSVAAPGWRIVVGSKFDDDTEWDARIHHVAAWQVREGTLHPVVVDGDSLSPFEPSENTAMVAILSPGDPDPTPEEMLEIVKKDYRFANHTKREQTGTIPGSVCTPPA